MTLASRLAPVEAVAFFAPAAFGSVVGGRGFLIRYPSEALKSALFRRTLFIVDHLMEPSLASVGLMPAGHWRLG